MRSNGKQRSYVSKRLQANFCRDDDQFSQSITPQTTKTVGLPLTSLPTVVSCSNWMAWSASKRFGLFRLRVSDWGRAGEAGRLLCKGASFNDGSRQSASVLIGCAFSSIQRRAPLLKMYRTLAQIFCSASLCLVFIASLHGRHSHTSAQHSDLCHSNDTEVAALSQTGAEMPKIRAPKRRKT